MPSLLQQETTVFSQLSLIDPTVRFFFHARYCSPITKKRHPSLHSFSLPTFLRTKKKKDHHSYPLSSSISRAKKKRFVIPPAPHSHPRRMLPQWSFSFTPLRATLPSFPLWFLYDKANKEVSLKPRQGRWENGGRKEKEKEKRYIDQKEGEGKKEKKHTHTQQN